MGLSSSMSLKALWGSLVAYEVVRVLLANEAAKIAWEMQAGSRRIATAHGSGLEDLGVWWVDKKADLQSDYDEIMEVWEMLCELDEREE